MREARHEAGLTQEQLARRLGVSQAAIAQLEGTRANPTLATLERAVRAAGQRLELRLVRDESEVDLSLLREALRMPPAERIAAAERLLHDADAIAAAASRKSTRTASSGG
ncbi:MAG TPA: helix-turn-helix domain-containing protein [Thermoleophilaceae bacterium]|nr:helix-turn-helix domain-containing protein [Thermoleophilaceae bacterium]